MQEITSDIDIQASGERVWQILTDFASFAEWNPFILQASGEIKLGEQLDVHIQPPGAKGLSFHPTITRLEPYRELRWLGHLFLPGLFDGEHIFTITPLEGGGVRFVQREIFKGALVFFFAGLLKNVQQGFDDMNQALKARAEQTP